MQKQRKYFMQFISTIALTCFISTNACANLYGKLEFNDGVHKLVEISNYNQGSMVNLYNPSLEIPYNTNQVSCMGRWYNKDSNCIEEDKSTFRTTSYNVKPLTLPMVHIITGGLLLMFGIISAKTCYFDYDAYYNTVANIKNDDLFKAIAHADNEFQNYADIKTRNFTNHSEEAVQFISSKYNQKYTSAVDNLKIKYKYIDKTGFFRTNEDLNVIQKEKNYIPQKNFKPSNYYISYTAPPAESVNIINSKLPVIDSMYASDLQSLDKDLENYKNELDTITSTVNLKYDDEVNYNDYHLTIQAPSSVQLKDNINPVNVTCIINSKDFYGIYPKYRNSDNNIDVIFDGTNFIIKNKTKVYLQLKSIAIYYNDNIVNNEISIELPPNSVINDIPITRYIDNKIKNQSVYPEVNQSTAKNTNINFGLAIKYHIVEQNVDKTLYNTTNSTLFSALKGLGKI